MPFLGKLRDLAERNLKIAMNVVGKRLQWRNINDGRFVSERSGVGRSNKLIDADEERRKSLPRPCGGRDKHVPTCCDFLPTLQLRFGRTRKSRSEPSRNKWIKFVRQHERPDILIIALTA